MKVTVEIPDKIGWVLAGQAERHGMKVGQMIAHMIITAHKPAPDGSALSLRERVRREWEKGVPDPVIAHRLGFTLETIRRHRRTLGNPNRFRRERWEHELNSPPASSGVLSTQEEAA